MRCAAWLVAAGLALALGIGPALAEKKVALVIGNADYRHARVLANPKNDAEAIAELLRTKLGFAAEDVTLKLDLDYAAMRDVVRAFAAKVSGADVALLYYAGHGIESYGVNYLLPIDAKLEHERALSLEAFTLDTVLSTLSEARKLKLVILDACRNNPLGDKMAVSASGRTRELTRGLKAFEPQGDMLVAYAAKAGTVALDGKGKHSPFAEALLKHMPTPGLDVYRMFGRVTETVLEATHRKQEPFVYGRPGGESIALVPAPTPPPPPHTTSKVTAPPSLLKPPPPPPPRGPKSEGELLAEVVRICRDLQDLTSLPMLRALAERHKNTAASSCIAARIEEVEATQKKSASVDLTKPSAPTQVPGAVSKTPDAPPKMPIGTSKGPDAPKTPDSVLKAPDGSPKAPDVASIATEPPGSEGVISNKVPEGPPPSPYDTPQTEPQPPQGPKGAPKPVGSTPPTECDRIAASPDSPPLPGVKAVPLALLDVVRAIPACQDAVARYPAEPRLQALLGRALHKAGRYDEARHWYERAIEKGSALALNNLGSIYESGQGVPTDFVKALDLYHRAAEAGNTFSLRNIGRMHEYGGGVPQDYAVARSWYEKAVQKGEPAGMHELGRLYQEGKGVPQDYAMARSMYEKAAALGYAPSMTNLGWLYETGRGGPLDAGYARSWYEKAVAGGNSTAAYNLAQLLARGAPGLPRDPDAAARHLLAAARAGNPTARAHLDGDMATWEEDVRRILQEMLTASGDYIGGITGWWDQASSNAARAYYLRSQ